MDFIQRSLYLVMASNGLTKIGISRSPFGRFGELCNASPIALSLIHVSTVKNAISVESALHEQFRTKRHHGEWFRLNDEDIARIVAAYPQDAEEEDNQSPEEKRLAAALEHARTLATRTRRAVFVLRAPRSHLHPFRCVRDYSVGMQGTPVATVTCTGAVHLRGRRSK